MTRSDRNDLIAMFIVVFSGITLLSSVGLGILFINVNFIENVPIVVKVDGKEVFSGPSAGCKIDSSGASTTVSIKGGLLYLFPHAYYVSKNVEVIGEKN